jgi:hypothetical protein
MHFNDKIKSEQEVMMNISDVIISIYVLESTLKRCEKIYKKTHNNIMLDISKSSIYTNLSTIKHHSIESVISYMSKEDANKSIEFINTCTEFENFNIKEINRNIANYFLEKKSYSLFNNFK